MKKFWQIWTRDKETPNAKMWLVWSGSSGGASHQYPTREEAEAKALLLAIDAKHDDYFIMEAVSYTQTEKPTASLLQLAPRSIEEAQADTATAEDSASA